MFLHGHAVALPGLPAKLLLKQAGAHAIPAILILLRGRLIFFAKSAYI